MAEFIPTGIGGFAARPTNRRKAITERPISNKTGANAYERHELYPPPKPARNFIPTQDIVDVLVERALAAITKGIYWDRGSIINIVL